MDKGLFVDIREIFEFDKEHILDSINIPLSNLSDCAMKLKDPNKPIILVHSRGQHVLAAVKQLRKSGFVEVYILNGGLDSWKEAKFPLF